MLGLNDNSSCFTNCIPFLSSTLKHLGLAPGIERLHMYELQPKHLFLIKM